MGEPTLSDIMQKLRVLTEDLPDRNLTHELHFIDAILNEALQFCPTDKVTSDPDELSNWFEGRRRVYRVRTADGLKVMVVPNE